MTLAPELFGTSCLALATFRSANRWICGLLSLAQISPYGETSHIPRTLSEIARSPYESVYKAFNILNNEGVKDGN